MQSRNLRHVIVAKVARRVLAAVVPMVVAKFVESCLVVVFMHVSGFVIQVIVGNAHILHQNGGNDVLAGRWMPPVRLQLPCLCESLHAVPSVQIGSLCVAQSVGSAG